ncbi:MAG: hypothetical protein FD155_2973 [Bacteroidetes bacterium]|nr:MAG: hypothetical protein FD155_2973 [Bacteroidota bacterium]
MDIAQFIRIIRNNLILLIAIPILLAIVVFYFTRNQDKIYESEAVIYTGITTGYSIESTAQRPTDFFSVSAQYDNLINLINSRQTIVETAIMLLAQNLSLQEYNTQYISNENLDQLRKFIPKHVKDLVVKYGKAGAQREKEEQIRTLEKELKNLEREIQTRTQRGESTVTDSYNDNETYESSTGLSKDEPIYDSNQDNTITQQNSTSTQRQEVYHTVRAGETLLTIAKKYGASLNKLREINDLGSQQLRAGQKILIESTVIEAPVVAYDQSNQDIEMISDAEYDTAYGEIDFTESEEYLNSLLTRPAYENTTSTSSSNVNATFIENLEKDPIIPRGISLDDFNKTIQNITNYYNSSDTNFVYGLLHYGADKHYSIQSIKSLQIYRINNSDLVRLVYLSDDPGICQQTLKIIAHVFVKNYKLLKENQTDMVVEYFKRQVDSADRILRLSEDKLLIFNRKNNIINYQEQTKYIAAQKEDLDLYYQNEQVRMAQSSAALRELETKLTRRDSIYLKSDVINQRRKEYADVTEKILINELAEDYDKRIGDEISMLRHRSDNLRDEIKLYVDQLYLYSHSTQGIPISKMLDEWLKNALSYEEAKASLVVLARRKLDFVKTYQRFAPLGAMLKRIEREMTIAEQTYLELLRSLNLAKMRQQNLQMATNIRLIDPPYFPLQANPSKAKYLVVAAAMIGFLLILFIILVLEYFDASLKKPEKVAEQIGLKLAGAYPYLGSNVRMKDAVFISNRLIEMIIQNIKRSIAQGSVYTTSKPHLVLFFSTQEGVGKTFLTTKIANKLRTYGEKVIVLNYADNKEGEPINDYNLAYNYTIKENFSEVKNLKELIDSNILRRENYLYDYILIEIPSIIFHAFPMELIQQVDASVLIVKATNSWNKADIGSLEIIKDLAKEPPMVILNEAEDYAIEEMISGVKMQKTDGTLYRLKNLLTLPGRIRIQVKEN